jgi:hypothetical protein
LFESRNPRVAGRRRVVILAPRDEC